MSQATEIEDLTYISFSSRDAIGYSFEVLTSKLLDRYGIEYNSNPLGSIIEWKKHQGKGVDFKIPELNIELEAKSGYARIFKSWILRDWISRFSYRNETRVIVVKPTLKLSDQCLDLLFYYNINIIYPDSISYLVKRGNKLIEAKNTKQNTKKQEPNSSKNTNVCVDVENKKNGNEEARTEEKTESLTSNDNIDVEREQFLNETLSRYPSLNKIRSSKECLGRHRVLVCSLKIFRPRYLCPFRVLYLKRHQRFPSYIENYGKIYVCKNPECTGEICKTLDLTCSFLVEIDKCPRMYKPKHFCLLLPKPKLADFQPNLTYYLNISTSQEE